MLSPLRYPRLWYGVGALALALVALLSLLPAPHMVEGSDKLLHLLTYACLAGGFSTLVRSAFSLLYVAGGLLIYGVGIEILQGLTAYRSAELADVLANCTGIVLGLMIWKTPAPQILRRFEHSLKHRT